MYFRVFIKFRVCTCIHDTRYTIHDIDEFRVYTVTSLVDTLQNKTEAQLVEISSAMHKFNVSNLKHILRFWRRRLIDIAKYSQHNPH